MQYETRIPVTIDSWYKVPRRPRSLGGDTSDTYIGEIRDAAPTASPPKKRAATKLVKVEARPVAADVAANVTDTASSTFLRPYRSPSRPANADPSTHPNRRQLNAQPRLNSVNLKCSSRNGPAPVMMAISNPNKSPPSAAVAARKMTYRRLTFSSTGDTARGPESTRKQPMLKGFSRRTGFL